MLTRHAEACLMRPSDITPSRPDFEVVGTFNPGVAPTGNGDEVVLLVRVAEHTTETRRGHVGLARWDTDRGEPTVDWVPEDQMEPVDPRVLRYKHNGTWRLTFTSHIRVLRSRDGRTIDSFDGTHFLPAGPLEEFGVEDPRITQIGETYYITYVAVSRHGPATALASTRDFRTFERHGVIFCPENKDIVLFPERVDGRYLALHRPATFSPFCMPEMWLAYSPDLLHWGEHAHFLSGGGGWDDGRIGGGPPPIRTDDGWLVIYHGKQQDPQFGVVGAYAAGALLLDGDDPTRVIAHTPEPILTPTQPYETDGFVPNVVFPTGLIAHGDRLRIYSGTADTAIGLVELSWPELRIKVSG